MATIETAEGETLIVETAEDRPFLYVEARAEVRGSTVTLDESVISVYEDGANPHEHRPRTRGNLTAGVMEDLANRVVGRLVNDGHADRREEVTLRSLEVYERSTAKTANRAYAPDWVDEWPEDGTKSDKVRYFLENHPNRGDEYIAAAVGCTRSLVVDVRGRFEDE